MGGCSFLRGGSSEGSGEPGRVGSEEKGTFFLSSGGVKNNIIFVGDRERLFNFVEMKINFWEFLCNCVFFASAFI